MPMLYRRCDLCGGIIPLDELCDACVADDEGNEEHCLLCPACYLDLR